MVAFDPSVAKARIEQFWGLKAEFGHEHNAVHVYLHELISDRYVLVNGLQLIHDELQLAGINSSSAGDDVVACGADYSLPSVLTTLAHTNCGDRIHQGKATTDYQQMVAARFATLSELGECKLEAFSPTGGGTDNGKILAHVTVAHALDEPIRERLYKGNAKSFVLVNIDLKTHCGRMEGDDGKLVIGTTQESKWREPRSSCGAIIGTLGTIRNQKADGGAFDGNAVFERLRADLGESNFEVLRKGIKSEEGIDITPAVAAAIVAVRGLEKTAEALQTELDDRGVGHLSASTTVNRSHHDDTILYYARATVFHGETRIQGFGTDASKYSGKVVDYHGDKRLVLAYDGIGMNDHEVRVLSYAPRMSFVPQPPKR